MNWDVNYVEGFNYAHGIADFFGIEKEKVGDIYGIVRDQHERFRDDTYVPVATHDDVYKPLDGVLVTLKKGDKTVDTYTTDNQFNGAFVFRNVEPGDYTLEFSVEGYKSPAPVAVSVKAAEVSYPTAFMESESYVPPTVTYTDYPDLLEGTGFGARSEYAFDNTKADVAVAELEGCTVARMLHQNGRLYILAFDAENNARIVVLDATTLATLATPGTEGCEGTAKTSPTSPSPPTASSSAPQKSSATSATARLNPAKHAAKPTYTAGQTTRPDSRRQPRTLGQHQTQRQHVPRTHRRIHRLHRHHG